MTVGVLGTITITGMRKKERVLSGTSAFCWRLLGTGPHHLREALWMVERLGQAGGVGKGRG